MDDNPLTHLADIELPAPPHWHPALLAVGAAAAVLAAVAAALWRRRRAPPPHAALRRLDHLMGQWQLGFVDDREAGYRLATLLRLSLGLTQLDEHCPAALTAQRAQWRGTIDLLRRLRYARTPRAALGVDDFLRIRAWVSAAPRRERRA